MNLYYFSALLIALCALTTSNNAFADHHEKKGNEPLTTIAFGSCARSDKPQPIWDAVVAQQPDLFLFIGDNVYVDVPKPPSKPEDFQEKYDQLAEQPGWKKLTESTPILAIWDDHDYGLNDAGVEFPMKKIAQKYFMDFYELPADSPVRTREGIYDAHLFGPTGKRVQVILLDTRYFRDPITRNPKGRERGLGPYIPNEDGKGTMLGDAQWKWLEEQLKVEADVRIIASSIQVVAYEHRWETWGNMPHERQKLYDLIKKTKANGALFISGDRHLIEISKDATNAAPYPMWDFTSSGFNQGRGKVNEPNQYRVGPVLRLPNFGVLKIDWSGEKAMITMEGRGLESELLMKAKIDVGELEIE